MAKVTGKFQLTLPKAAAEACGIRVGDDLRVRVAGGSIRLDPRPSPARDDPRERLVHFDAATARQRVRNRRRGRGRPGRRGWAREELYTRGRTR